MRLAGFDSSEKYVLSESEMPSAIGRRMVRRGPKRKKKVERLLQPETTQQRQVEMLTPVISLTSRHERPSARSAITRALVSGA